MLLIMSVRKHYFNMNIKVRKITCTHIQIESQLNKYIDIQVLPGPSVSGCFGLTGEWNKNGSYVRAKLDSTPPCFPAGIYCVSLLPHPIITLRRWHTQAEDETHLFSFEILCFNFHAVLDKRHMHIYVGDNALFIRQYHLKLKFANVFNRHHWAEMLVSHWLHRC